MTPDRLAVLLGGDPIGSLHRDRRGRLAFEYEDAWRTAPGATPLSLSMPLAARAHGQAVVEAFLWGLLPDNDRVLDRWGRQFGVSARNAFALIASVGEDCAGAVQFVRPERMDALAATAAEEVEWLDERGVGDRLRALRVDPAAWREPGDRGQFSLAGAQPKTALLFYDGRWGVPAGRTPTTRILKPPAAALDGHAENEHLCLALARALGLPAAQSEVRRFDGEPAIVVERYDRVRTPAAILRVHQEDACQALGVPPVLKYQNDGGPSPRRVIELLREHSSRADEDVQTFADALVLNWIVGGTDAHAKNYSVLLGAGGRVRLAPLYDIASALPYRGVDPAKLRMAMKIGSTYRLRDITTRQWAAFAEEARLGAGRLLARAAEMCAATAETLPRLLADARRDGLDHPILDRLAERVTERAAHCAHLLTSSSRADAAT